MVVKSKGNLLISGKSGLVKYYNLTRYKGYIGIIAGYTRYIGEYNYHLTQISGCLGDLLGMRYYPIIWDFLGSLEKPTRILWKVIRLLFIGSGDV